MSKGKDKSVVLEVRRPPPEVEISTYYRWEEQRILMGSQILSLLLSPNSDSVSVPVPM